MEKFVDNWPLADGRAVRGEHHDGALEERSGRTDHRLGAVTQCDACQTTLELHRVTQRAPFRFGHVIRAGAHDADERGGLGHDEQRKSELDTGSGHPVRHGVVPDTHAEAERTDVVSCKSLDVRAALVVLRRKPLPRGEDEFTAAEVRRGVQELDAVHPRQRCRHRRSSAADAARPARAGRAA